MGPVSKNVNYLLVSVLLFLICPPLQCFFINPFTLLSRAKSPPIKAQPITFKVRKDKLKEVTELLRNNPEYLKELTLNPRNSRIPITVAPSGPRSLSSNGLPTIPVGRGYGATKQLPEEILIGGQKYFKTTRAALLMNQGIRGLNSAIPAEAIPSIPDDYVNYKEINNKPKKNDKEEKKEDDESEYEYEYEYDDEDDEDDKTKKNNNDKNKKNNNDKNKKNNNDKNKKNTNDNNKKNNKKNASPEQNRERKSTDNKKPNKKPAQYEDSAGSGENLSESENDSSGFADP